MKEEAIRVLLLDKDKDKDKDMCSLVRQWFVDVFVLFCPFYYFSYYFFGFLYFVVIFWSLFSFVLPLFLFRLTFLQIID